MPDKIVFPLAGLALVQVIAFAVYDKDWKELISAAVGVAVVSGIFYVLFQVSNGKWIGGGDVKVGLPLGLLVGGLLPGFLLLFVASATGLLASLPMIIQGKARRKSEIPFGPFLILGLVVVTLFGSDIINWYGGLIYG